MMATLNAVTRPRSFDTTTADHVTGDSTTNPIDHKVCVTLGPVSIAAARV